MSERDDIVKRLMDYDRCHDGDVDEAADEIVSLRQRLAAAEAAYSQAAESYAGICHTLAESGEKRTALEQRLAAAEAALNEANRRLAEIRDELCGNNLDVVGWHLNGDLEPLDTWWENNDWGPVEAAKGGRDDA